MKSIFLKRYIVGLFAATLLLAADTAAQAPAAESEGFGMTFFLLVVAILGVGSALFLWQRSKKGGNTPDRSPNNRYQNYHSKAAADKVDSEMELEWLRKAKGQKPENLSQQTRKNAPAPRRTKITATNSAGIDEDAIDTKAFQEKMRKLQYGQLPINSVTQLAPAAKFEPLPYSDDDSLLNAIDQANEEFEEDQEVREIALRILAAFRTRNSVDTLSQIALYDLSSHVRSKAVTVLTEFDHESVFEGILLACADPTREVRAAAARGLFRLSFDRADAWKRIIETRDGFRMRHASRAAIEAGIVHKAFDRLIHDDLKIAYEAIVLVALMIEAGETKEIFEAIRTHRDERVRYALLHVLKMMGDDRTQEGLVELSKEDLPVDVMTRVKEAVNVFEQVAA